MAGRPSGGIAVNLMGSKGDICNVSWIWRIAGGSVSLYACKLTCLRIFKGPRRVQSSFLDGSEVEVSALKCGLKIG